MADPQRHPMKYDPATGKPNPAIADAAEWRERNNNTAWLYDPWTGIQREAWKVGSDPFGLMVLPDSIQNSLDIRIDVQGHGNMTLKEYFHQVLKAAWIEGYARGLNVLGTGSFRSPVYGALIQHGFIQGKLDDDGFIVEFDEEAADKFVRKVIDNALDAKDY